MLAMASILFITERVAGIEPASRPWKGRVIAIIQYPREFRSRAKRLSMKFSARRSLGIGGLPYVSPSLLGARREILGFAALNLP